MNADDFPTLIDALSARWPGVEFAAEPFDCGTRLGVAFRLPDGARGAAATPVTMDWRALSVQEWMHRFGDALAPRLDK